MRDASMRMIVFCRESFPTTRVDIDILLGAELAGRLGHEIDFVMQAGSKDIHPGPHLWYGRTVWVGPTDDGRGVIRRLRKYLSSVWHDLCVLFSVSRGRYQAIQVRDKFLTGVIAAMVARIRGLRFFYWLSFPIPESRMARAREGNARYPVLTYLRGTLSGHLLYRIILPLSDHVFVQSQQMKEDVCSHGIGMEKVTPVPMGVALRDIGGFRSPADPQPDRPNGDLVLAYLGTLNPQRHLEILVDMLRIVRDRGIAARLVFIGGGDDPQDSERLLLRAREQGVSQYVQVTGLLPRDEALRRVRAADVGLSPFYPTPILRSTSPTKLVEYLAVGMPVIANDHPEQRRVLEECRAGLCVPWGARHFARAVVWLARRSETERSSMGERGRQWVLENRTYPRIAEAVERCYGRILRNE